MTWISFTDIYAVLPDLIRRRGGQSAVQVNSLMHDCHVTMQVLNRLTQRHLLWEPQHLSRSALASIMQTDLQIMREGRYDGRVEYLQVLGHLSEWPLLVTIPFLYFSLIWYQE